MRKQQLKIFIMILIIGAFLLLIGNTYAYFQIRIIENKNEKSIEVTTKTLQVIYRDGTAEFLGSHDGYIFPGETFKKYWTVENTGDDTAHFDIILRDVTNTFTRKQDWTYQVGIITDTNSDGIINSEDQVTLLTPNPVQFPDSGEKFTIFKNRIIAYQETLNFVLIVNYANSEESQSIDMNQELTATVDIASSEVIVTK